MDDKKAASPSGKQLTTRENAVGSPEATDDIETLRIKAARYRKALESIRDQKFEPANSPRLTDQLWHFVRWSKATAREALGTPGEKDKK